MTDSGTPMGMPLVSTTMPRLAEGSRVNDVAAPWLNPPEWLRRRRPA